MSRFSEAYRIALFDPQWTERRNEIRTRDKNTCQKCGVRSNLEVHHKYYVDGRLPWGYPNDSLITICSKCHQIEHLNNPPREYFNGSRELLELEYPQAFEQLVAEENEKNKEILKREREENEKRKEKRQEKISNTKLLLAAPFLLIGSYLIPLVVGFGVGLLIVFTIGGPIGVLLGMPTGWFAYYKLKKKINMF